MSEIFPESGPSPFGPDGPPSAMVEEGRRALALDLAVRTHCARISGPGVVLSHTLLDSDVLGTADRFAEYLRGGGDG